MSTAQQGDQGLLDHFSLAENDFADTLSDEAQAPAQRFDLGDEIFGGRIDGCGGVQAVLSLFKYDSRFEPDTKLRFRQFPAGWTENRRQACADRLRRSRDADRPRRCLV